MKYHYEGHVLPFLLTMLFLGDDGYVFFEGPGLREANLHPCPAGTTFPGAPGGGGCIGCSSVPGVEPGTPLVREVSGWETRPEAEPGI